MPLQEDLTTVLASAGGIALDEQRPQWRERAFTSARPFLLALVLFSMPSSSTSASEAEPTAQAGAFEPARGWIELFGGASTANAEGLEGGAVFGGGAAFYLHRNIGFEVGVQRTSQDAVETPSNRLSGGSADSTIITGSVLLRLPSRSRVTPYLLAGVAYFSNSLEVDPAVRDALADVNFSLTEDLENKLGFNVGAGLDIRIAPRFAVFGEGRYFFASTDTSARLTDTISGTTAEDRGSQDLNGLDLRGGIRIVF